MLACFSLVQFRLLTIITFFEFLDSKSSLHFFNVGEVKEMNLGFVNTVSNNKILILQEKIEIDFVALVEPGTELYEII